MGIGGTGTVVFEETEFSVSEFVGREGEEVFGPVDGGPDLFRLVGGLFSCWACSVS